MNSATIGVAAVALGVASAGALGQVAVHSAAMIGRYSMLE
jgi:hypothetical protein